MFAYWAYGLNIVSDIECPELAAGRGAEDVRVRYGSVPEQLANPGAESVRYRVTPHEFVLQVERIGRFRVRNGNDIVIERPPEAAEAWVRVPLLGIVLGALLHQRGVLPLHASVIETERGAVAFAGPVGLGKSTLAAAFHQRGYRVLADDVCAISLSGSGSPLVTPGYPQLNLRADALQMIGSSVESMSRSRQFTEKYGLPVAGNFCTTNTPLYAVYELRKANTPDLTLSPVKGLDKLTLLRDNTYGLRFLVGRHQTKRYSQLATSTARHIRAVRVIRPDGVFWLDELVDRIVHDWMEGPR